MGKQPEHMSLLNQWLDGLREGNTFHAVLLAGPNHAGKKALARRAAALYLKGTDDVSQLINCPFYKEWEPLEEDGKKKYAEAVRICCDFLQRGAFGTGRHCIFFPDLHLLNITCQNAMLKTLEEPPADSLLLITGHEENILPTIRSRCMILRMGAAAIEETEKLLIKEGTDPGTAALLARWADGMPERARNMLRTDYAAFKTEAARMIGEAIFSAPPFEEALKLCTEEKKADAEKVSAFLELACGLLRDADMRLWGVKALFYPDEETLTRKLAGKFSKAELRLKMQFTLASLQTLSAGGGPKPVLDEWLANIAVK